MRKVILFIAISLDGYIADKKGDVDWLTGQDSHREGEDSYAAFEQQIDTVIMGRTTYHQIITQLSPKKWVYENLQTYVITHRKYPSRPGITFVQKDPCTLTDELKHQDGKDIWICGGADIAKQLMAENLIDQYHISVIPTILGDGISLFHGMNQEILLRLVTVRHSNGITELIYEKR